MKSRWGSMTILKMFILGMIVAGTAAMSFDGSIQGAHNFANVSVVAPAIVAPANPVSFSGAVRGRDGAPGTDTLRARQGQPGSGADLASMAPMVLQQTLPLAFTKSFTPNTIGPGSTSTLTLDITNSTTSPASDVAFTDSLPAAVVIATPARAFSDCGGILSASDGGATISLSGGRLGASESCTTTVNVTSSTVGTHTNNAGVVTSSVGGSNSASDDLIVDGVRPGFTKSFAPSTITPGGTSTLTFTINNSGGGDVFSLQFVDSLPAGMVIATPASASTDCVATISPNTTITAISGTSLIQLGAFGNNFPPHYR